MREGCPISPFSDCCNAANSLSVARNNSFSPRNFTLSLVREAMFRFISSTSFE